MFDFHIHTRVSFDSDEDPLRMAKAARAAGMKAICFTDHLDYDPQDKMGDLTFATEEYNAAYDELTLPGLEICRGMEFGMLPDNRETFRADLQRRPFDFVIGSLHFLRGVDAFFPEFWEGRTVAEAERIALEETLVCVQRHDDFDVLGHLTYISKAQSNPEKRPVKQADYQDLVDEIFRVLVQKGKGLELNTGAVDICGAYLPALDYFRRFRELGGQIVTVGSDAHSAQRVGQYCHEAVKAVGELFGYVCTFKERKPVFHRI